jgi:hypothetical protein
MTAMCLGLIGEIIGYISRILPWNDPFDPTGNEFLVYQSDIVREESPS